MLRDVGNTEKGRRVTRLVAWPLTVALAITALGLSPALAGDQPIGFPTSSAVDGNIATVDSDSKLVSTSFSVSGTLVDEDGSPMRKEGLAVYLDPGPAMLQGSVAVPGVRLAVTRTKSNGDFQLEVPALKNISAYLDAKGQVTLQFMSFGDQHSMLYQQKVQLPSKIGAPALAAVDDSRVFSDRSRAATTPVQGGRVTPALSGMKLTGTRGAAEAAGRAGVSADPVDESSECTRIWGQIPWGSYWWVKEGDPIKTWVPVQRAQTGAKTTLMYAWNSSSETSTEVAINFEYQQATARGGFTGLTAIDRGVPFDVGHNVTADLEVEYDFYAFRLWCSISGDVTNRRDARITKALPVDFTGGNQKSSYSGSYSCPNNTYRIAISSPLWVSTASTTVLSGGTSIFGVSLSTQQVNTTAHTKTYTPVTTPAYLCGQDGLPANTEKVSEVSGGAFVTPNSSLNALFKGYGDSAGCADWSGADATQSVRLPSGKRAWFFADSFLNSPTTRGGFHASSLRNSIVIQNGNSLRTITGGNTCREGDTSLPFWDRYAKTPFAESSGNGFYWPGDAMVVGNNVVKFFYRNIPSAGWWTDTHSAVATIPIGTLENNSVVNIQPTLLPPVYSYGTHPINWGLSLLPKGSEVYIYGAGIVNDQNSRRLFLAKSAPGNLANPNQWTYYTGSGWSTVGNQAAARPVSPDLKVENGFSVVEINGSYWLIQHEPGLSGGDIVAHPAAAPSGFGTNKISLYTPPEGPRDAAHKYQFYYEARVHPDLGASGEIVVSYNVNTSAVSVGCGSLNNHDGDVYRPRFLNVPEAMFQASSATAAVTPKPIGSDSYRPGIRNHPLPGQHSGDPGVSVAAIKSTDVSLLSNDYGWYDSWAPAQDANGGCPPLDQSTALRAIAEPNGHVHLNWSDYGRDMWYWVYSRDATAGEPFQQRQLWTTRPSVTDIPVMVPERHGHTFEWYVVPWASRGSAADNNNDGRPDRDAARSNIASLTVRISPPAKVTGVSTTRYSNGVIGISWGQVMYPSPNVYYYVDSWDVSAGQTEAQAVRVGPIIGPDNVSTALSFERGHLIAFRVRAQNIGGFGPPSDVVEEFAP